MPQISFNQHLCKEYVCVYKQFWGLSTRKPGFSVNKQINVICINAENPKFKVVGQRDMYIVQSMYNVSVICIDTLCTLLNKSAFAFCSVERITNKPVKSPFSSESFQKWAVGRYDLYTLGFMKLGFEWSEIDTAPFFSGILPNLSFPQVSSSYDIGKWWGHPQLFWSLDPLISQLNPGILKQPLL